MGVLETFSFGPFNGRLTGSETLQHLGKIGALQADINV
jgi:hypothetical protein